MASDSQDGPTASISLPADLDEWLDERARALDCGREELIVQLLASYRAAEDLDDDLGDPIAAAVDERLDDATDDVAERLEERLETRIDALEEDFQSKIVDVRERVIQVKKDADAKAPKDHSHEEFDELDTLATVVEAVEASVDDLEESVDAFETHHETAIAELRADVEEGLETAAAEREDLDDRLADASDKLRRVAWVVSDLKEEVGGDDARETAVARIKRAAAQEGVTAATCDSCGESVEIALLTAPECPHCEATVSDVRPSGGIFRKKARLVAAAQLESGDEGERS